MNPKKDDVFSFLIDDQGSSERASLQDVQKKQGANHGFTPLQEGRLAIDAYDMGTEIVVLAPMAGVDPQSVEVSMHEDILTIRGEREVPPLTREALQQYHAECYWGPFSRSVVLPTDVVAAGTTAEYTHGLLTIHIPKAKKQSGHTIRIEVVEE